MSSEHVAHLQRMANESWIGSPERAALDAAIAALSAPAEAQPVAWLVRWQHGTHGRVATTFTEHGDAEDYYHWRNGGENNHPVELLPLYAAPPSAPVGVEEAEAMGAAGGPASEPERLAFEAWMRGHCWALCATWDGTGYRSDAEQGGRYCPDAARTRMLWAAWRDRATLAQQPAAVDGAMAGWIADGDTIPACLIEATRDAIRLEFGNSGTDGYYKRILVRVFTALTAQQGGRSDD